MCKCKSFKFVYLCFGIHKSILYKCDNDINASRIKWRKCLKKCTIILCVTQKLVCFCEMETYLCICILFICVHVFCK